MEKYTVIGKPLYLYTGVLELTEKQYDRRARALKPLKKGGHYEITVPPVCFKMGEIIGCQEVNKGMRQYLEPVEKNDEAHVEMVGDKITGAVKDKRAAHQKKA